ncbi:MAG: ABC transporter permease [Longimicrobiales bacterium]
MASSELLSELRFALRGLARNRAFTGATVLTLGLGIGASTAVFTLVDGVLIRPLPFRESERLVSLQHIGRGGQDQLPMSTGLYVLYARRAKTLEALSLYNATNVNLVMTGEPERIAAQVVTPGYFGTLGVKPARGREFSAPEGAPGGAPVVLLSDGFRRRFFGADADVLGKTLDINGRLRTVVGVLPADFGYPDREAQLFLPMIVDSARASLDAFGASAIGRLAPGATTETLHAELQGLIGRLSELFPESGSPAFLKEVNLQSRVLPLKESLVGEVSTTLWILLGTVGFVLLIACANVANLLLVRAESRQRELVVRVAIGAGRWHVLRWFLGESFALAAAGGLLGLLIATLAVRTSINLVPTDIPRLAEIGVNLRVAGFTAAIALGCALFFGFFPWLRLSAGELAAQLRDGGGRGATSGRERHRLRNALVVAQVALALLLLVGAGLMARSYRALSAVDPGFRAERVLTARITVPQAEIQTAEATARFFRDLRDRLAAQSGVESVGFVQGAPLAGTLPFFAIDVADHPRGPNEMPVFASNQNVEVGYFETLGIRLLEGRTFQRGDGAEGTRAVVVSRAFAQHWWPNTSPIGRRMRLGFPEEDWYTIVGVVADVHYARLEDKPEEAVYWPATVGPAAQPQPTRVLDVVVRTTSIDPTRMTPVLRREVSALNARVPVSNPRALSDLVKAATARVSFTMALLAVASGIALLLGLIGIYGVITYIVTQRTREIGVRMALGATAGGVRAMVLRQGLSLAFAGVLLGLLAAAGLSSVMGAVLYGVRAIDPLTYAVVSTVLLGAAAAASWLPARRAAALPPSIVLRADG